MSIRAFFQKYLKNCINPRLLNGSVIWTTNGIKVVHMLQKPEVHKLYIHPWSECEPR